MWCLRSTVSTDCQRGVWPKVVESVFIIGGASIYEQSMKSSLCNMVYLTKVFSNFECDTFMPDIAAGGFEIDESYTQNVDEGEVNYQFQRYTRISPQSSE